MIELPYMAEKIKLSRVERKILNVLEKPKKKYRTVKAFCQDAGISTPSYYATIRNPSFQKRIREVVMGQVPVNIPNVMKSCVENALSGSYIHQKLLFIIGGLYNPKLAVDISGSIEHSHSIDFMKMFKGLQAMREDPKLRQGKTIELSEDEVNNLPEGEQAELAELIYEEKEPEKVPVESGSKQ